MSNKKLLRYWQNRLELNDWAIVLYDHSCPDDFILKDACGECGWQEVNRTAVIRILDERFYGVRFVPYNFERTLVHELLHLKFAFIDESENLLQNKVIHNLIGSLSRALVPQEGSKNENK